MATPVRGQAEIGAAKPNLILCGHTCTGKTTVAAGLSGRFGYQHVQAAEILAASPHGAGGGSDRRVLQLAGKRMEDETDGRWLAEAAASQLTDRSAVIDSARTRAQLAHLRDTLIPSQAIFLAATAAERHRRFTARRPARLSDLRSSFEDIEADPLEMRIDALQAECDLVVDTSEKSTQDIASQIAAWLDLERQSED